MGKTVFVAIFTIAVLLAGTISYGISSYTLPTAAADDDDDEVDADLVLCCYGKFLNTAEMCGAEFESDSDLEQLEECMEQAVDDFEDCVESNVCEED